MDLAKRFRSDLNKEEEGVRVDLGEGAAIWIARAGNKRYREVFNRLFRPHRKAHKSGTLPEEIYERILSETLADGCIRKWEALTLEGEALPYSPQTARDLMQNPQYKDFRAFVAEVAGEADNFRNEELADAEGN